MVIRCPGNVNESIGQVNQPLNKQAVVNPLDSVNSFNEFLQMRTKKNPCGYVFLLDLAFLLLVGLV